MEHPGLLNAGDDVLWDEIGEEVPAQGDNDQGSRKRKGRAVPPGEYFTVVKGTAPCTFIVPLVRLSCEVRSTDII